MDVRSERQLDAAPDIQFFRRGTHTATKTLQCDVCGEEIQPGHRYVRQVGTQDGVFFEARQHKNPHCIDLQPNSNRSDERKQQAH